MNPEETTPVSDSVGEPTAVAEGSIPEPPELPPEMPEAAVETTSIEELEAKLAAAQKEAQDNLDGWQRARAEFLNYKKRIERDLKDSQQKAELDVLAKLLPILDDFERAMSSLPEDLAGHAWLEGITLIQRKFQKLLDDHRVTAIDPTGQPFDPSRHEALGIDENTEVAAGHITVTLQKGYVCGERVLRPALVRVAGRSNE